MAIYYMPVLSEMLGLENIPMDFDKLFAQQNPIFGSSGELNPFYGKEHSEEHKNYMSTKLKNRIFSQESRQKMSNSHKGKTLSVEHKQNISKSIQKISHKMQGKNNPVHTHGHPQLGKHMSEASKLKTSETLKNNPKVMCPNCGKLGASSIMKRWHFDNCRN